MRATLGLQAELADLEQRLEQTWESSKAGGSSRTARPAKLLRVVSRKCGLKAGLENLEHREQTDKEVLEAIPTSNLWGTEATALR